MRLLQVILPVGIGGVENIAYTLHSYMSSAGIESKIAIGKSYYEEFFECFSLPNSDVIMLDDHSMVSTIHSIRKVISSYKPDIIHTHARRECVYVSLFKSKAKHIRTQHMAENPSFPVTLLEKALLANRVDCWAATSKTLVKEYFDKLVYIKKNKICVVYNGVKDKYNLHQKNFPVNKFCIVARITKQKGIDLLINKLALMDKDLLQKIRIDIYGEGPELLDLLQQIKECGLQQTVVYMGTTNDTSQQFCQYKALLMPSRYEGLPLTMLEAMACALPVATHDVGCCREFIRTNENGWIINEEYTWETFFRDFIEKSEEQVRVIANNARKQYLSCFSSEGM